DIYRLLNIEATDKVMGDGIKVEKTVTIERSPQELYRYWRNLEHLPLFMSHLESVKPIDNKRSHWIAKAPAGMTVEWDAEITAERPDELIAWQSINGAEIKNEGYVRFS